MELREVSRLEVTIIIVISSSRTSIRYRSIERYFIVLVTRIVLRLVTYRIYPK